jgi:hypothetical protein
MRLLRLTVALMALIVGTIQPTHAHDRIPRRLLIVEGNSISAHWPNYTTWPDQIRIVPWMRLNGFDVLNLAVSGSGINAMAARAGAVDAHLQLSGYDEFWLVVWEYTNTMTDGRGVQATYDQTRAYVEARRAAGFRVLIGTGISRDQMAVYHQPTGFTWDDMQRLNQMTRETWPQFADGLIDFGAIPELGSQDAPANRAMLWDAVHPTDAASALMRDAVLAELQSRIHTYYAPIAGQGANAL